jgi:nucleoside-diphosphate-sugar epimerase
MRLLVLGGTNFVGHWLVEEALRRGDEVTTVNRGVTGTDVPGVRTVRADRREPGALEAALGDATWDAVVDTWSLEPAVVRDSARLLADRASFYGYVSSRSVYRWPFPSGVDESAPVVDADPGGTNVSDYAAAKRGGELAVLESFEGRALLARAGLILGPREDVGRLPWWLSRLQRGGRVLAPGPKDRPLQYVDARDLAAWMLSSAERGVSGAFNAVSPPGHTTIGELLETCVDVVGGDAELVWVAPEVIEEAGLSGWTDVPIWVPPTGELAGLHDGDVSAAQAAGLRCRPVRDTVVGTWAWLQEAGPPAPVSGRGPLGVDPDVERRILASVS